MAGAGVAVSLRVASVVALVLAAGTAATSRGADMDALPTAFLDVPGGRLAYDDTGGTGPLVIAIPGMGDMRQEYRFLRPVLARAGFRVVTLDLRGFGATSARWADYAPRAIGGDVRALEAHLGRGSAAIVANSYAACAAVWAAHDAPSLVRALVLLGPVLRDPATKPGIAARMFMMVAFAGPWRVRAWLDYWDGLFVSHAPPDQAAYRAALARNLAEKGRMHALDIMIHTSKSGTAAILGAVRTPTLIVMGTRDPDQDDPASEARWIASRTGGAIRMIDGAGHYPQTEDPAAVGADIVAFLRGNGGGF